MVISITDPSLSGLLRLLHVQGDPSGDHAPYMTPEEFLALAEAEMFSTGTQDVR